MVAGQSAQRRNLPVRLPSAQALQGQRTIRQPLAFAREHSDNRRHVDHYASRRFIIRLRHFNDVAGASCSAGSGSVASLSDDPDEFTDRSELTALHQRGLEIVRSEFEDRTWQIFWRVAVDEVPTADVAEEFGITANSVRQNKSRVLRRLRQVLGE